MSQWDNGSATRGQVAIAWLAVLPASGSSGILYRVLFSEDPSVWLAVIDVVILALFFGLAYAIAQWRSLRGYFLALVALSTGSLIADRLAPAVAPSAWVARIFVNTFIQLIPCALLALSLIGSGLTRRDVFLARGTMTAQSRMPRWLPSVRWSWFGPFLMLILAGGLAIQLVLTVRPDVHMFGLSLRGLPFALAFAAVNAAQEEFRFRAVLLSRLVPTVGTTHALLVTSLLFGLAHWFGHPSGPSGVLLAGFAGYMWGKSMVETGGSAWAWLIHGFQDVLIFEFLIMAHG
jgi:membrane protease YdiL (CAAX protease family)